MAGEVWTDYELTYLISNFQDKSCEVIAKEINRTRKSVVHKFNQLGLKRHKAQLGDIVHGWEIIDVYSRKTGTQNVTYAKIRSTFEDKHEREEKLTRLTLEQIPWPDRRRPDNSFRIATHGLSKTRLYGIWKGMKNRCFNKNQAIYISYGGRGITVCDEWLSFEPFKEWCDENGYNESLTLDRIDVNGNYCPENCRWADSVTQGENKRNSNIIEVTAFGETKSINRWVKDIRCNVNYSTIKNRIYSGWESELAITKPSERNSKQKCDIWLKEHYPEIYKEYLIS